MNKKPIRKGEKYIEFCRNCNKKVTCYVAIPRKFCSRQCTLRFRKGKNHPMYKGGTVNKQSGYKFISVDGKQIQEHRYIMQKHLNRKLKSSELVHHKNGDKLDNRVENLEIVTRSEHKKIHDEIGKETRLKKLYHFDDKKVLRLYKKYKNVRMVAKDLGCSSKTIERQVRNVFSGKKLWDIKRDWGWYL